ncbi:protease inhibitor I42 family protein [Methanosarcina sp. UBA5]|uniref:protease inhibitor I42 family protein n=1 Tax=Methanosarcina sp. UBA5 TaxID=1915593 RepID=UPI0025FBE814|nr:protease inhibitor I42 family protein [Methanosarcina sp. UBA5]
MKIGTNNKFLKYAKTTTILLTAFVVIFSGCVGEKQNETESENTTNNSQGIPGINNSHGTGGDYIYGTANVESIQIVTLESFPVQIQVIAKGYLPDGCTEIDEIKNESEGNVFNINISTKRPKDAFCTQVIKSFTETISLEVRGLKAGNYTVNVNGVTKSFELPVNNVPEEASGSMPPKQQVITEADNGTSISLENGSTFFLRLKENPTTGYSWELNLSQGLNNISGEYYPPEQPEGIEQPLVGAGGVHLWKIKAVSEGSQQVTGIYKRPWEKVTGNEEKFTLNVEVV